MSNHLMPDGFDVKIFFKRYVKICQPNMKNHLKPGGFYVKICFKNMMKYAKQICKPGGFDALSKDYFGCLSPLRFAKIQISKYSIYASPISFDAYI